MKLNMKDKSNRTRITILVTYLTVVLFMGIIFFAGSYYTIQRIRETDRDNVYNNVSVLKKTLDDNWLDLLNYSIEILTSSDAKSFENQKTEEMRSDALKMTFDFQNFVGLNRLVDDIYLFYPRSNTVIGTKGVYSAHQYWVSLYGASKAFPENQWQTDLFGNRKIGYFVINNGQNVDLYYRVATPNIIDRMVVCKIDANGLRDILNWFCIDGDNQLVGIVNSTDEIFAFAGNKEELVDNEQNILMIPNDEEYISERLQSDITNLSYVVIKENSSAFKLSRVTTKLIVASVLLAIISGFLLSVVMSKKSSKPIERIANKLNSLDKDAKNDLLFIEEQIDEILRKDKSNEDVIRNHQKLIAAQNFLNDALKFGHAGNRETEIISSLHGIVFENTQYCVVVRERKGMDNSEILLSILTDEKTIDCILWTQIHDLDVVLINYDEDDHAFVQNFIEELKKVSDKDSKIVVSRTTTNLGEIKSCYLDCLRKINRNDVIVSKTIVAGKNEQFRFAEEQTVLGNFQNFILDGDYSDALLIIPELVNKYINCGDELSFECRKYNILNMILRQDVSLPQSELMSFAYESNYEKVEQKLTAIVQQMAQKENVAFDQNDLAGQIRSIVDSSYTNPMMSLALISEKIGISQSYVSRLFKSRYGIGLSSYLTRVRIDRAKKLLREDSCSIKEIAIRVGFSSDAQFIRTFKKCESITPGMYRENKEDHA